MRKADEAHAWTIYWRQSETGGGCLPSAPPDLAQALQDFWRSFARLFPAGSRLIDLGCGTGAVAHLIAQARPGVAVTGVDFSQVPPSRAGAVELHSGVRVEALPFADGAFDGAVSQFGIEYSDVRRAAAELARVLKPGAPVAFAVHHVGSPIIEHNRRRDSAIEVLTGDEVRSLFIAGEREPLAAAMRRLASLYRDQDVVTEFSMGLGQALALPPLERQQLWADVSAKAVHERAILRALSAASVEDIAGWLAAFQPNFSFEPAHEIADSRGAAFAWAVKGTRL